jgi:hypothetical protein
MATSPRKPTQTVTINYTTPAPGDTQRLQILNDPGGNRGELQINGRGGVFTATNNLAWNGNSQTLNIRGSIRLTGNILGNIQGNPSYLKIIGGNVGDVLATDGAGNLSWQTMQEVGGYGNTEVAAYLPTFNGNLKASNANLGNAVVANYFVGNGTLLTGLPTVASTGNYDDLTNKPNLVTNLNSLTDVTITSPANGQSITYNGNAWVNSNINLGVTSYNSLTDKPTIPTKTSDITNDSTFVTLAEMQNYVNNLINIDGANASASFTTTIDGGNA